jgi:hypothetical protein
MGVVEFILAIVGAVAWPAALVGIALMLRPKKE